jgi:hypothetical protein
MSGDRGGDLLYGSARTVDIGSTTNRRTYKMPTDETPTVDPAPETPDVAAETPETTDLEVGQILDSVPAKASGGSRPSVWTDRINTAVDQLIAADKADGIAGAVMFAAKTPKTATTTANKVRKMISEGRLTGLVEGGEIVLVARGKTIFVTFKPSA